MTFTFLSITFAKNESRYCRCIINTSSLETIFDDKMFKTQNEFIICYICNIFVTYICNVPTASYSYRTKSNHFSSCRFQEVLKNVSVNCKSCYKKRNLFATLYKSGCDFCPHCI